MGGYRSPELLGLGGQEEAREKSSGELRSLSGSLRDRPGTANSPVEVRWGKGH